MASRASRGFGQYSGTARALERVGERWALLILRDLLSGARRYSDLKASLPRIPTNILSDRLKELQEAGLVRRVPTVRGGYELTALGRAVEPVVVALERWGWSVLGERGDAETVSADALTVSLHAAFRAEVAASMPPTEYVLHVGGVSIAAVVSGETLDVVPVGASALPQPARRHGAAGAPEAILELEIDPEGFGELLAGAADPAAVSILAGEAAFLERFTRTFRIDPVVPGGTNGGTNGTNGDALAEASVA